jgi:hypothetical protein
MGYEGFKLKDLCRIMELGSACGVSELKFADVHIKFAQNPGPGVQIIQRPGKDVPAKSQQESQNVFDAQTKEIVDNYSRDQLLVEDPFAHEENMIEELMGSPLLNDQTEED